MESTSLLPSKLAHIDMKGHSSSPWIKLKKHVIMVGMLFLGIPMLCFIKPHMHIQIKNHFQVEISAESPQIRVNVDMKERAQFSRIEEYLETTFHDERASGVTALRTEEKNVLTRATGFSNEELQSEMTIHNMFGIGSNTKLFTSVALYQLQERNLLNVSDPVSKYLDANDFEAFGFPNQTEWCPKLHNSSSQECEHITFVQLMSMSSGIPDAFNCDNLPPNSPHCFGFMSDMWAQYKGSIGYYVGLFINDPLVFRPGTSFSYSNPNFVLAAYMVEKISGQSLESYFSQHIFEPAGLESTVYDPYAGLYKAIPNYADSYIEWYANDTQEYLSTGSCRPYMSLGGTSGAGGIVSTIEDLMSWYEVLFSDPDNCPVLSRDSIMEIIKPWNPVHLLGAPSSNEFFTQGLAVVYDNVDDPWPSSISYCGGLKCTVTCIDMKFKNVSDLGEGYTIGAAFTNHIKYFLKDASMVNKPVSLENVAQAKPSLGMQDARALEELWEADE